MNDKQSPKRALLTTLLWCVAWPAFLLPSCAPKAYLPPPIQPKAAVLNAHVAETAKAAKKHAAQTAKVNQDLSDEAKAIQEGKQQAEALRKAKTITQAQLDANARLWEEMQAINQKAADEAKASQNDARALVEATTQESTESSQLEKDAGKVDEAVTDLKTENAKLSEDASAWRKLKWAAIIIGVVAVVMFFAFEVFPRVIQAVKPPGT